MALKSLNVVISADTSGFQKGLRTVQGGITKMKSGLSSLAKGALALTGVAVGLKGIADSMKAYVGLESSISRVNGLFGDASKYVQYFAEKTAKSFGMAESSAYQYAAVYGNLFKNITASSEENAKVTIAMMKASAVVASKTGRTMEDVMERIRSGLLGNTEAIEDLGIYVNVAMLEATDAFKRIADGRSWDKLTFYEQQQVRTLAILEQAHTNFGDSVQQGSAFSLSVLAGAFKDLQSTAGVFINKALMPIVGWLTQIVQWATAGLKALASLLGIKISGDVSGVSAGLSSGASSADDISDSMGKTSKAAKDVKKSLAGFDEINILSKDNGTSGASRSGSGAASSGASVFDSLPALEYGEMSIDTTGVETALSNVKALLDPTITAFQNLWVAMDPFKTFVAQGLMDFYNNFLVPVGAWTFGEGIPRFIDALSNGFASVNWGTINQGLAALWSALAPFAVNIGEGLLWFWETVLVPLGTWTMNTAVSLFLDLLSAGITAANKAIDAIRPAGQWLFENFFKPIAEWAGGKVTDALSFLREQLDKIGHWFDDHKDTIMSFAQQLGDGANAVWTFIQPFLDAAWQTAKGIISGVLDALLGIGDWILNHGEAISNIAIVIGSFAAAWWLVNTAVAAWSAIGGIAAAVTTAFGTAVAFLTSPITLVILAIGAVIAIVVLCIKYWDEIKAAAAAAWESIKATVSIAVDKIKTVFTTVVDFFKNNWKQILLFIVNPFSGAFALLYNNVESFRTFINGVIDKIQETFNNLWDGIKSAAGAAWDGVVEIWSVVSGWFNDHIITPVKNFFTELWDDVKSAADTAWTGVKQIWNVVSTWFDNNIVTPVKTAFSGLWSGIESAASTAWTNIKNVFEKVSSWFDDNIITPITTAFKGLINGIIRGLNTLIRGINKLSFDVPDWVPGIGGKTWGFDIPQIPMLAEGGIIDRPTIAMIGEAGTEAVMPLENNTGWIDILAGKLTAKTSGSQSSGGNITIPVYLGNELIETIVVNAQTKARIKTNGRV